MRAAQVPDRCCAERFFCPGQACRLGWQKLPASQPGLATISDPLAPNLPGGGAHSELTKHGAACQAACRASAARHQRHCLSAASKPELKLTLLPEGKPQLRGHLLRQGQVGLEEGLDRPDVLPIVVEEVRHHLQACPT